MLKRSTSSSTGRFSSGRSRHLRLGTAALSVALLASGLVGAMTAFGSNTKPTQTRGHEASGQLTSLTWEIDEPWEKLTSVSAGAGPEGTVLLATEPLILLEPNGTFKPNLGTELPQRNPTTVVFKLHPGVKFWDGKPLTPQDVVWSLDQNLKPAARPSRYGFVYVKSIQPPWQGQGRHPLAGAIRTPRHDAEAQSAPASPRRNVRKGTRVRPRDAQRAWHGHRAVRVRQVCAER